MDNDDDDHDQQQNSANGRAPPSISSFLLSQLEMQRRHQQQPQRSQPQPQPQQASSTEEQNQNQQQQQQHAPAQPASAWHLPSTLIPGAMLPSTNLQALMALHEQQQQYLRQQQQQQLLQAQQHNRLLALFGNNEGNVDMNSAAALSQAMSSGLAIPTPTYPQSAFAAALMPNAAFALPGAMSAAAGAGVNHPHHNLQLQQHLANLGSLGSLGNLSAATMVPGQPSLTQTSASVASFPQPSHGTRGAGVGGASAATQDASASPSSSSSQAMLLSKHIRDAHHHNQKQSSGKSDGGAPPTMAVSERQDAPSTEQSRAMHKAAIAEHIQSYQASQQTTQGGKQRFGESHTVKWQVKYKQLVDFVKTNGHALVPLEYPENPALAHWVKRQRCQYKVKQQGKHSTLTEERQALLDAVGFVWDSHQASWAERIQQLREFKKEYGHANVPSSYPMNQPLAIWVKCQRRQYKLYKQGKPSKKSLKKQADGNSTNSTSNSNNDGSSSNSKSAQSCNITTDRIKQLEELGFCWEPRKKKIPKSSPSSSTTLATNIAVAHKQPQFSKGSHQSLSATGGITAAAAAMISTSPSSMLPSSTPKKKVTPKVPISKKPSSQIDTNLELPPKKRLKTKKSTKGDGDGKRGLKRTQLPLPSSSTPKTQSSTPAPSAISMVMAKSKKSTGKPIINQVSSIKVGLGGAKFGTPKNSISSMMKASKETQAKKETNSTPPQTAAADRGDSSDDESGDGSHIDDDDDDDDENSANGDDNNKRSDDNSIAASSSSSASSTSEIGASSTEYVRSRAKGGPPNARTTVASIPSEASSAEESNGDESHGRTDDGQRILIKKKPKQRAVKE